MIVSMFEKPLHMESADSFTLGVTVEAMEPLDMAGYRYEADESGVVHVQFIASGGQLIFGGIEARSQKFEKPELWERILYAVRGHW